MKITNAKEILSRKFNCLNIIISIILAYILCIVTYKLFYPICVYSNLHDFYVGESIYANHNKQFDINIIYLYIAYFFTIYIIPKPKIQNIEFSLSKFTTYKPLIIAIMVTIAIYYGIILIGNLIEFSFPQYPDTHHYGEKFATYFAHKTFQMEYYKDIMLVHGLLDIFPSFIADKLIGNFSISNECIGVFLVNLLFFIINLVLSIFIFRGKSKAAIILASGAPVFILNFSASHILTFVLLALLLIEYFEINDFFWYSIIYITTVFVLTYQTTYGTACFLGMCPFLLYRFYKNPKSAIPYILCIAITACCFSEQISNYLDKAVYYVRSNIYAFGTCFPSKISIANFTQSIVAPLLVPFFILLLMLNNDKKIKFTSLYIVIVVLTLSNYMFGRLDMSSTQYYAGRILPFSAVVIYAVIPYIIYKLNKKTLLANFCILALIIPLLGSSIYRPKSFHNLENYTLTSYTKEIPKENITFLDLTNCGMNYYYTGIKPAIAYTSFYNIVNSQQVADLMEQFIKYPPNLVLLSCYKNLFHDDVRINLRINEIYRWLFLSGLYEIKFYKKNIFMIYKPNNTIQNLENNKKYRNSIELNRISTSNIKYLPDAWGASMLTLPLQKGDDLIVTKDNVLLPSRKITPNDYDLLYIERESKQNTMMSIRLNDSPFNLICYTKQKELLIPIDNFPAWLMEDSINELKICSFHNIKIKKATLYKRNLQ